MHLALHLCYQRRRRRGGCPRARACARRNPGRRRDHDHAGGESAGLPSGSGGACNRIHMQLAALSSEKATDVQTVTVLVIFHVASAVAGMIAVSVGESVLILWNVLARAVIVAGLVVSASAALRR